MSNKLQWGTSSDDQAAASSNNIHKEWSSMSNPLRKVTSFNQRSAPLSEKLKRASRNAKSRGRSAHHEVMRRRHARSRVTWKRTSQSHKTTPCTVKSNMKSTYHEVLRRRHAQSRVTWKHISRSLETTPCTVKSNMIAHITKSLDNAMHCQE